MPKGLIQENNIPNENVTGNHSLTAPYQPLQRFPKSFLKSVFADLKDSTKEDLILKSMIKARETELKLKADGIKSEPTEEENITSNTEN